MALREDAGMGWLLGVSVPVLAVAIGLVVTRLVPQFRSMQTRIDTVNRVLREQISGIRVVRAFVREPEESARFATANDELTATGIRAGRLMALMFPTVHARAERVERRRALGRRRPHQCRHDADRLIDSLPDLSGADPDVGHDGDLHAHDVAARAVSAPTASARCSAPSRR